MPRPSHAVDLIPLRAISRLDRSRATILRPSLSIVRGAELRTEEPHAPILLLQSVLKSLEPRWQARLLPSINQRTLRFCNRLFAQVGPRCDRMAKTFIFLGHAPAQ